MLLAQTTQAGPELLKQVHQAIEQLPGTGLQMLFVLVLLNLVGTIVVIHRLRRLASNQIDLGRMIGQLREDIAQR